MGFFKKGLSIVRLIGAYVVANTQSAMEYRTAFWMQIVTMIANDSLWLFFWWSYFRQFPLVHGWQSTDIVILWSISACAFGLSAGVFGNATNLGSLITNGGLDAYLGMPRTVLLHACIGTSNPSGWGDMLFAIGAYLLLVHPDPAHIMLFLFLTIVSACIFTAFFIACSSLAFFLGNTEGLTSQMIGAIVTFSTYPMDIFHGFIRLLLFTVIPAGFISFIPLQLLHQFSWPLLGGLIGGTIAIVLSACGLFYVGLRRYESGNLLGMQAS